jgi:phosphopantothenoylcysteine decarboxylase/phosphopantothenate--cysteine ligase
MHPWGGYAALAMDAFRFAVSRTQGLLRGRRIVVTAGGTREALDPVRFITNRSSGLMGHALAQAARDRGADLTLISSAGRLPVPCGVSRAAFDDVASLREVVISGDLGS